MNQQKVIQELILASNAAKEQLDLISANLKSGKMNFPKEDEEYEKLFTEVFNSTIENLEKAIGDGRKFLAQQN